MYYLEAFRSRSDGMNAYSVPSVCNGAENMRQKITPSPHGEDRSTGCVAQPSTYLFDRESGTFHTREQVVS